jgi:hypothetical protein
MRWQDKNILLPNQPGNWFRVIMYSPFSERILLLRKEKNNNLKIIFLRVIRTKLIRKENTKIIATQLKRNEVYTMCYYKKHILKRNEVYNMCYYKKHTLKKNEVYNMCYYKNIS